MTDYVIAFVLRGIGRWDAGRSVGEKAGRSRPSVYSSDREPTVATVLRLYTFDPTNATI